MPKPLSIDLRKRIALACETKKIGQEEIAKIFSVGSATVKRIWRLWREKRDVTPMPHGGGMPRKIDIKGETKVMELVREKQDRTTQELTDAYNKTAKIKVSRPNMGRVVLRLKLTRKKNSISVAKKNRTS
jgi:transposase